MPAQTDKITPLTEHVLFNMQGRIARLEHKDAAQETEMALVKQDLAYLKAGHDTVVSKQDRLMWVIVGTFLTGFVTYVGTQIFSLI